ncbi:hypothetical protein HELRODRAFT_161158 [Helobdella robusta]|uniref:Uncharacterized protein n=1 Tax=Helobdella robusta TaxID=6412 RepID=T1ER60_HELRO|nr:hypothetical protein HELRODRAFT_161158 [Helobdella robusta]ESO01951.1 hypothetical protein HELRODRAFT_161158 [Helobdella robusta]
MTLSAQCGVQLKSRVSNFQQHVWFKSDDNSDGIYRSWPKISNIFFNFNSPYFSLSNPSHISSSIANILAFLIIVEKSSSDESRTKTNDTSKRKLKKKQQEDKIEKYELNKDKTANIFSEKFKYKKEDRTEENLTAIKKLAVVPKLNTKSLEKILQHENSKKRSNPNIMQDTRKRKAEKSLFTDRDFDLFQKEYIDRLDKSDKF